MFHLMIIILFVSICELQALPCGYPDSLAVNRYYSGYLGKTRPKNYVTVNVKIPEKADTRTRRDVNGVLATAITEPDLATCGGARISVAGAPVADLQCDTGSERSRRIADDHMKRDVFDGTTTRWYDKPFTWPTTAQKYQSTCDMGFVSGRPVTSIGQESMDGYFCERVGGQTAATDPRRERYGVNCAATDLRRNGDGPTGKLAAVVSAADTDTATALRTPEDRHWLKKLHHASDFPLIGGVKRLSVSLGTVVPKRLLTTTRVTNGLRRLSTKRGTHVKKSRRFGILNTSPVAKSPDGDCLSPVITDTLVSVHHPAVRYNAGMPFGWMRYIPWHPHFFLSLIGLA